MLQVTFRQTLPSESLITLARTLFSEWPAQHAADGAGLRCHITIDGADAPPRARGRFRVRVDVGSDVEPRSRRSLRISSQGRDAASALRYGMQEARTAWTSARTAATPNTHVVSAAPGI